MAVAYWLVPALTGRKLFAPKLALVQTWQWFTGMLLMSIAMHVAGLLGFAAPHLDVSYFGAAGRGDVDGEMIFAAIGGTMLFISILMFVVVAIGTRLRDEHPASSRGLSSRKRRPKRCRHRRSSTASGAGRS